MTSIMIVRILVFLFCHVFVFGEETATVDTPLGTVKGLKLKCEDTGIDMFEFRGVPYGKPTVGKLRFSKPEPFGKWENTLDGTKFKAACPQFGLDFIPVFARPDMSEDCLILNIYVPKILKRDAKKSVMVFLHGGGFSMGHGHQYDGGRIATAGDVIVVTINYRLGIFGLLSTDHPSARGNWGLWDQHLALQWVHDNIAAFGGDPESVTLFGQSAGGYSVVIQALNPLNKGLFQRAISQSGSVAAYNLQKRSSIPKHMKILSEQTKCPLEDMYKFVDCLRGKSVDEIINATNPFNNMATDKVEYEYAYLPIVDGDFLKDHPVRSLDDKHSEELKFFGSLDFMTGLASEEGSIQYMMLMPDLQKHFGINVTEGIPSKFVCQAMAGEFANVFFNNDENVKEKLCKFYSSDGSLAHQSMKGIQLYADYVFNYGTMKLLEQHSLFGGKTYQYIFSKVSPMPFGGPPPSWFKGSGHGDELVYFFNLNKVMSLEEDVVLSENDKDYSNKLIKYWTSFAKSGIPDGGEGSLPWKQFDMKDKTFLNFDDTMIEGKNYKPDMVDFWSNQLPQAELDTPPDNKDHDEL